MNNTGVPELVSALEYSLAQKAEQAERFRAAVRPSPTADLRMVADLSTAELIEEIIVRTINSNGLEFAEYADLDLLQQKFNEELVRRDEPSDECSHCAGTGEGAFDTSCSPCRGSGVAA